MSKSDFMIGPWFNAEQGKDRFRATHFGPHGTSSKTCASHSEAMAFINTARNRKPARAPDVAYRQTSDYVHRILQVLDVRYAKAGWGPRGCDAGR